MQEASQEKQPEKKELTPVEQAKMEYDYAVNADKAMNTLRTVFNNFTIPVGLAQECLIASQFLMQIEAATKHRLEDTKKAYEALKELKDVGTTETK